MLLAIDVGNTNIVLGVFDVGRLAESWRLATFRERTGDEVFPRARRRPRVDLRKPPAVIGGTTVTSMQSGLFYGYVSMVDGIVARMRAELAGGDRAACIATGGMADILASETTAIERVGPGPR